MTDESSGVAMAADFRAPGEAVRSERIGESTSEQTIATDTKVEGKTLGVKTDAAPEPVPTLRQIFSLPEKETDPADDQWKTFQETLSKEVKGIKWTAAMPDLAPKICELLDIKVPDVLIAAWKKVGDLQKVLEESKKTPEKVVYLELADHSIDYQTKPSIDVKVKSATIKKLELVVQLAFKLKGFVLKIQNGAIKEMETGDCEAKGTIKYGSLPIAEKKLEPIKLPLSIPITSLENLLPPPVTLEREKDSRPETIILKGEGTPKVETQVERIEL